MLMIEGIQEGCLASYLFDPNIERRKKVLKEVESFCRSIYTHFYTDQTDAFTTGCTTDGDEMEVVIKFHKKEQSQ